MPFGNPLGYTTPLSGASRTQPAFGGATPMNQPAAPPAIARSQPAPQAFAPAAPAAPAAPPPPAPPSLPPQAAPQAGQMLATRFAGMQRPAAPMAPAQPAQPMRPALPVQASPVASQAVGGMRGLDLAAFAQQLRGMWGGGRGGPGAVGGGGMQQVPVSPLIPSGGGIRY